MEDELDKFNFEIREGDEMLEQLPWGGGGLTIAWKLSQEFRYASKRHALIQLLGEVLWPVCGESGWMVIVVPSSLGIYESPSPSPSFPATGRTGLPALSSTGYRALKYSTKLLSVCGVCVRIGGDSND